MSENPKVVVLGGGFGGLESAFFVRHKLGRDVDLTLVSDRAKFLYKPNTIYVPFGQDPEDLLIPLEKPAERQNFDLMIDRVQGVVPENRKVRLASHGALSYDYLVIATGSAMSPEEIPGLAEHAHTVWNPEEMLRIREGYRALMAAAENGEQRKLLFLVPPNNKCVGPLYEMVLMTDTYFDRKGVRDNIDITWATHEGGYVAAFGPRLNTVVGEEFEERGINGYKDRIVTEVTDREVKFQSAPSLDYDMLVTFPPYRANLEYPELPSDERGFIKVNPNSRRVKGYDEIFAVGDAGDFPIKQAFIALLQADAAGEHLTAAIEDREPEHDFEPMAMCVMEEFNKATFAQIPLEYTGDPLDPIRVAEEDPGYVVGVSPVWRMGKKVLGLYLPWRFGSGEPFHSGFAWGAMDMGLKVMANLFAD